MDAVTVGQRWPTYLEQRGTRSGVRAQDNDVLFARITPCLENGKLAQVPVGTGRLGGSTEFIVVRPGPRIDPAYLYYWCMEPSVRSEAQARMAGATGRMRLSAADLAQFRIPVPPLDEQRRIVALVEDHLSRLDAADVYVGTATAKLRALRDRLVISAISGAELAERAPATLTDVGTADGDLPSLPTGWSWGRLGDVADVVGGVTKDAKKQADPAYVEVPYLRVANVQRGHLKLDEVSTIRVDPKRAETLRLRRGDVLLNEGGDRDKLARGWVWEGQIADCIHQNHVFRARVHEPRLDPYFLSWTANTIGGRWAERNGKQSVNLASISLSMIKRMPVIIPPEAEARGRAQALAEQLDTLDRLDSSLIAARTRAAALRRSLLAAAFSGALTGASADLPVAEGMICA
jgi:type I restriction enzyme S subunit